MLTYGQIEYAQCYSAYHGCSQYLFHVIKCSEMGFFIKRRDRIRMNLHFVVTISRISSSVHNTDIRTNPTYRDLIRGNNRKLFFQVSVEKGTVTSFGKDLSFVIL